MICKRIPASASALAGILMLAGSPAYAAAADYRFELAGKPQPSGQRDVVQIRLVRVSDGKAVSGAVIFESRADMGPAGMAAMAAPVRAMPAAGGIYGFEVEPGMTGTWAIHLAAKVQGEAETVRGTVSADLVK